MKCVRTFRFMILLAALLFLARPVAAETYEKPALHNIIKSLIRFGAIDIYDNDSLDIIARTNECAIYKTYYPDAFAWEKVRGKLREKIRNEVVYYPTGYRFDKRLQLDRYDFENKIFPFSNMEHQNKVNTFTMDTERQDFCQETDLKGFPISYKLVLDKFVVLDGLRISEEEGKALAERMKANHNPSLIVYASFNIRVMYIAALATASEIRASKNPLLQTAKIRQSVQFDTVQLDSHLDSIDYYEDEARTRLIYTYRP